MFKKLLIPLISLAIIILGTIVAIRWGKGYRPTRQGIQGTGLLAANSFPAGAQVFINGKLTTATDDTLNLPPSEYDVEIKKDGYFPWKKHLIVQAELVTQTNATLFPAVPSLTPLTFTGAVNVTPSPDGTKLALVMTKATVSSQNGLYILDLAASPLAFRSNARQIARGVTGLELATAEILWSPDSRQIILQFVSNDNLLISATELNDLTTTADVTSRLPLILSQWEEELTLAETQKLLLLPDEMQKVATASAKNSYFSPDETKLMYTATEAVIIPEELIPALPSSNTQPEERSLEPGGIYIYDLKEDRNFRIGSEQTPPAELPEGTVPAKTLLAELSRSLALNLGLTPTASPAAYRKLQAEKTSKETVASFKRHYSSLYLNNYQWFPTSRHLIINTAAGLEVVEYDGTNRLTLYSGPRVDDFVYAWPDGSKLVILTNLGSNDDTPVNLYSI